MILTKNIYLCFWLIANSFETKIYKIKENYCFLKNTEDTENSEDKIKLFSFVFPMFSFVFPIDARCAGKE